MANFWQIKRAIVYIFGVIILQHTSPVYAECQRPTGDEYTNTIFTPYMDVYTEGSFVLTACEPGYTGEGAPSSYCQSNGDWEPSPLICYSDCERPGVYDDVTYSPIQESYTHGSIVTYECVDGTSDLLGDGQSVCQNGVWDPRPTSANPSCSGIRTVPPTTRPQTSATTSGSTTSNQLSTDATTQPEGTTDTKMTTVTTLEKTEGISTGSTRTESPTTGQSLTQTDAPTTLDTDVTITSASFSTTSVSDLITVSEVMTTMSGQTDEDRTVSDSTEPSDRSTVFDVTDQTKSVTISEATDLTEVSTVSEATDQTERSTAIDSQDQTDISTVADNTNSNTVSEITETTDGSTVSEATEQTELTTVQTESSTLTDGTELTHVSTVTGTTEPNEDTQTTGLTSRMQTGNTNTQGTDQPTNEPSPSGSVTDSLATESPGLSTATNTEETRNPTTVTSTLESEQTTPEQFSDVTTNSRDTSSTLRPITDLNSQTTNTIQTTTQDQTDMTDLSTDDASTETTASSLTTMTTMPSGSQDMTSSALGTSPLESDPTTLSTERFSSQPTEDAITTHQTEGLPTQAPTMITEAISNMSTDEMETVSAGTSDETTREPTEGLTTSTDMAEGTTVGDLSTVSTNDLTKPRTTSGPTTIPPVEDLCNGQCDETREICVETSCECQEGFQRPYEESTCEPTTFYSISMTILEIDGVTATLTSDLRTTGSNAFNDLQLTICTAVTTLLDGVFSGFKTCSVTGFTAGSIIADIRLGFTNTSGVDMAAILDVVMTSELYQTTNSNFTINPNETSVTPTDECELGLDDCSPRADCKDLAENSFTCQCWDGYADYSPDGYDGRNCAAYNWKLITIVVGSCAGAFLLAACVLVVCGSNIIKRCTKRQKVITSGTKPATKHDIGVTTDDEQDIIPWHHREKDEQIFYAHHVDGQEARRLNTVRNVRGNESYDNVESYKLDDFRSSHYDQEDRYVPTVM